MRKLKTLWRTALSARVWEELEIWIGVLLFLGAAVLLFLTLKTQAAYGGPRAPSRATHPELAMAAGMPARTGHASARREAA
jgi:hypothetical protein